MDNRLRPPILPHGIQDDDDSEDLMELKGIGYVTNLEPRMPKGVIDGTYFFEKTIAGPEIVQGSRVSFYAVRKQSSPCWEATKLTLALKKPLATTQIALFTPRNKRDNNGSEVSTNFDYSKFKQVTTNEREALEVPDVHKRNLMELREDKNGVKITPQANINFELVHLQSEISRKVVITNSSNDIAILNAIDVGGNQSVCEFRVEINDRLSEDIVSIIDPGRSKSYTITCIPKMLGSTKEYLFFKFDGFEIMRILSVVCRTNDSELLESIRNERVYVSKNFGDLRTTENIEEVRKRQGRPEGKVFRGPNPLRPAFFKFPKSKEFSKMCRIPDKLWQIVQCESDEFFVKEFPVFGLGVKLCMSNYLERFRIGLWLEEVEDNILRSQFDCTNPTFEEAAEEPGAHWALVENLRNIYPPLMLGDKLTVHDKADESFPTFETYIYKIDLEKDLILVKFVREFNELYKTAACLTIEFHTRRTQYERCHYAIGLVAEHLGAEWLFPKDNALKPPRMTFTEEAEGQTVRAVTNLVASLPGTLFRRNPFYPQPKLPDQEQKKLGFFGGRLVSQGKRFESDTQGPIPQTHPANLIWFNKTLNLEQKNAVRAILRGRARPLPYIIFGPPGTGKTVTAVEAIHQVYKMDSHSRILVVAPSNSAADVIVKNILQFPLFKKGDFVRLVGFSRQEYQIPPEIRQYCHDGEVLDAIAQLRVVICTCGTAGQFYNLGIKTGHYTHVFIDEAGYCTEPEAIIACSLVALGDKDGQVILTGDPKQLGPVLMSTVAANCGLNISLLERLTDLPLYSRNPSIPEKYNPDFCTKLLKNYRSHPILLKLPSLLFYDDELIPGANESEINLVYSLTFMAPKANPIIFHGIRGRSLRERSSPSWYNIAEIGEVVFYVERLRNDGVSFSDIGIITPYRKQVEKIRAVLRDKELGRNEIKVGSVEEFQGQERKVIILSLVRSEPEKEGADIRERLVQRMGFIHSSKRFNVAITRAKALLVVIGDPYVLKCDTNWFLLILYCIKMGAYTGCNLPTDMDPVIEGTPVNDKENTAPIPVIDLMDTTESEVPDCDW